MERYSLPFSFFDAVDGRVLNKEQIDSHYDKDGNSQNFKRQMSNAEIACYMSHKLLWKEAVIRQEPILILEDDFSFFEGVIQFIEGLDKKALNGIVIKLDGHIGVKHKLRRERTQCIGTFAVGPFHVIPPHTTGYIIGHQAAEKMLRIRDKFSRPVDTDLKHHWEHDVPIRGVYPRLLSQEAGNGESAINNSREIMKPRSYVVRFFRNLRYQAWFRLKHWTCPQK